jgi:hypothetical protein
VVDDGEGEARRPASATGTRGKLGLSLHCNTVILNGNSLLSSSSSSNTINCPKTIGLSNYTTDS